jgi:MmpS family membrane protein
MTMPGQSQPVDPYNQHPAPPKPKGKKKWPWVVGIVTAFIVIGAIASGQGDKKPTTAGASGPQTSDVKPAVQPPAPQTYQQEQAQPVKPATHHVKYAVTGAKRGSITYNVDGMTSIQQETDAKLPWSKEFDWSADEAIQIAQVSVQNGGSGQITCTITVDGAVVKTATSKGAYAIASCDESIGTMSH